MVRTSHLRRALAAVPALLAVVMAPAAFASPADGAASTPPGAGPAGGEESTYVVVMSDGTSDDAVVSEAERHDAEQTYEEAVEGYTASMTPAEAASLEADPAVEFVAEDRVVATLEPAEEATAAAQLVGNQVRRIGGPSSSTLAGNGAGAVGVNIAVIDSGVDRAHPDLNVRGGVDCSSGSAAVPGASLTDQLGHGTLVAGVVAARDNGFGVVGTAPGAPVWSVRVADANGRITISSLVCAVDWVTSTRTDADRGNDIALANISIAGSGKDDGKCGRVSKDPLHAAICGSVRAGVAYVVAAGNASHDLALDIPASYDQVLAVTAAADTDGSPGGAGPDACPPSTIAMTDDAAAPFSNFAVSGGDRQHTVAAPGACITSTSPGGAYSAARSGTSFASPVAAGTLALCLQGGQCPRGDGVATTTRFRDLVAAYNRDHPDHGFAGDPARPNGNRYYGDLVAESPF
ncbi:subtilisin family serine protease [Georgenia soli]|uniref:Subtilisin family serine protease n=1 Tax=Georgenia soli TaxID=638953 RepID=A0A2A9EJ31_9MICO|nr:S8 family serine peptidase [Georgenia soli]PFG39087.1 subtilisin family serine protease [Georgenia soli]